VLRNFLLFAFACTIAGPSALAKDKPSAPAFSEDSAPRLLAEARKMREETGCIAAAPTYRVVAAMGAGEEAAQHELGECLLLIDGVHAAETALFRQEGEFWLTRAAFAGNARAQRALAVHFGSAANPHAAPAEALKWALVYAKNGEADLYGFKTLPPTFVPGLKSALSAEAIVAAEGFASEFAPIALAAFRAPKPEKPGSPDAGSHPGGRMPGL